MTEVSDLQALLRSVANKMENGAGELSKDMLMEVADKIEVLDEVAREAAGLIDKVPVNGDGSTKSLVFRSNVQSLVFALNRAGRYGPNGSLIPQRRP